MLAGMARKSLVKKVRKLKPEPKVKKQQSKPVKRTGLSKSDPNYFSKIGKLSAKRRKMSSEAFAAMAKLSHAPGVRKSKNA